ncbi:MATE family efflux transporter [Candidatus Collinsella stercoripullorum]|uniref:MATE family efflux transporter n=1 Tax=Candidatus Collinsella stercoripullorum TaxID=2838522 RepID=UPI0022DF2870|nr:MATE family efflux transporter [Candidatus Collinsella stercoripullorum]
MADTDAVKAAQEERELGTQPIPKLFVKYASIAFMGMVAQIIMVVFEGIIMGNGLGAHGLACVSIIMSVELMNVALGSALAVGVSTVAGNRLGAGDTEGAKHAFSQGFWLTTILIVVLIILAEIFVEPLVTFLGATPDIFDDTVGAIRVFLLGLPFCVIGQMLCGMLRIDEKPHAAATIQIVSAVVAIIWLAASTFVLNFGVTGAGLYYAISIGLWFVVIYYFVGGKRSVFQIRLADIKLEPGLCLQIIKIGLPLFLLQATSSVYTTVVNNQLGVLGSSLDIAAFAVINGYVVYIIMMVVQAITYGVQPIAAYNAGAKAYGRMKELLKTSLAIQVLVIAVVTVIVWAAAYPICLLFAGDPELASVSADATRIVILLGALGWSSQVISSYFECVERVVIATVLGIARYIFFTIPAVYVLGGMMGVQGVWWAQPVADVLTFALVMVFVVIELKRLSALEKKEA